jgi:hypothetical protein
MECHLIQLTLQHLRPKLSVSTIAQVSQEGLNIISVPSGVPHSDQAFLGIGGVKGEEDF